MVIMQNNVQCQHFAFEITKKNFLFFSSILCALRFERYLIRAGGLVLISFDDAIRHDISVFFGIGDLTKKNISANRFHGKEKT